MSKGTNQCFNMAEPKLSTIGRYLQWSNRGHIQPVSMVFLGGVKFCI
jgi:hypothetical protein